MIIPNTLCTVHILLNYLALFCRNWDGHPSLMLMDSWSHNNPRIQNLLENCKEKQNSCLLEWKEDQDILLKTSKHTENYSQPFPLFFFFASPDVIFLQYLLPSRKALPPPQREELEGKWWITVYKLSLTQCSSSPSLTVPPTPSPLIWGFANT